MLYVIMISMLHSTPKFRYVGGCLPMSCCPGTRPPVPLGCSGFLALPCYTAPTKNFSVKVDVHKPVPPSPFCIEDTCPCPAASGTTDSKQIDCVEGRISPPRAPLGRSFCEQCKQALWNCCEGPCPAKPTA